MKMENDIGIVLLSHLLPQFHHFFTTYIYITYIDIYIQVVNPLAATPYNP